jgi:hypothetical protein
VEDEAAEILDLPEITGKQAAQKKREEVKEREL